VKCLRKYQWVKLPRCCLPQGKGVLGQWDRLAERVAYRRGTGRYCGFENHVKPGMWAGGVVGLKSILGIRSRKVALNVLEKLQSLGYVNYTLDPDTKKLEYSLMDWIANCPVAACLGESVYAARENGFSVCPGISLNVWSRSIFNLRKQILCLICGVTRYFKNLKISFRTWTGCSIWHTGSCADSRDSGYVLGLGKTKV